MGGGKGGSSSTTGQIPPWLESAVRPLMQDAIKGQQSMQSAGWDLMMPGVQRGTDQLPWGDPKVNPSEPNIEGK